MEADSLMRSIGLLFMAVIHLEKSFSCMSGPMKDTDFPLRNIHIRKPDTQDFECKHHI